MAEHPLIQGECDNAASDLCRIPHRHHQGAEEAAEYRAAVRYARLRDEQIGPRLAYWGMILASVMNAKLNDDTGNRELILKLSEHLGKWAAEQMAVYHTWPTTGAVKRWSHEMVPRQVPGIEVGDTTPTFTPD